MKLPAAILLVALDFARIVAAAAPVEAAELVEWKKVKDDDYRLMAGRTRLAELMPDAWGGNLNILSPKNQKICGVNWPHFLMYSEGKWLTDKVESEGLKLIEFKVLEKSGPVASYSGTWQFRDYFTSTECHFAWYDADNATQVHLIKTKLEVLKELPDISSSWVEFMTPENSYTTVAAKTKGGKVVTMDVSATGQDANMHYLDGSELATDGWITIYGAAKGQDACVAMIPISHGRDPLRPRINNGHVDNIEIHVLDARKHNLLKRGRTFSLDYLLIVGPDQKEWKWVEPAAKRAKTFMTENADLVNCPGDKQR